MRSMLSRIRNSDADIDCCVHQFAIRKSIQIDRLAYLLRLISHDNFNRDYFQFFCLSLWITFDKNSPITPHDSFFCIVQIIPSIFHGILNRRTCLVILGCNKSLRS